MIYEHDAPLFTLSASDPSFADQVSSSSSAGSGGGGAAGDGGGSSSHEQPPGPAPVRHVEVLAEAAESPRVVLHHGVDFHADGTVVGREPAELPESLYTYVQGPRFTPKREPELPVARMARKRVQKLVTDMLVVSKPELKYDKFGRKRVVHQYLKDQKKKSSRRKLEHRDLGGALAVTFLVHDHKTKPAAIQISDTEPG